MKEQIEFRGASGAAYRFRLAENGDPKTTISGNFIYVRDAEAKPEVVYAGATTNLASGVREKWDEAVKNHGATHIYTRLNIAGAARAQELSDLVDALHPVMNEGGASKPARRSRKEEVSDSADSGSPG
ncbi:MAG TPA: hypothetical protein VFN88_00685 [Caulobacteraceae bacterium]|nr:hypothetical protein [Caulobacteraceae bacterium]